MVAKWQLYGSVISSIFISWIFNCKEEFFLLPCLFMSVWVHDYFILWVINKHYHYFVVCDKLFQNFHWKRFRLAIVHFLILASQYSPGSLWTVPLWTLELIASPKSHCSFYLRKSFRNQYLECHFTPSQETSFCVVLSFVLYYLFKMLFSNVTRVVSTSSGVIITKL